MPTTTTSTAATLLQHQHQQLPTPTTPVNSNPASTFASRILPPLPPLAVPLDYRGPTPWSNWVIKGRVIAGAYPASCDDTETDAILTKLLELGINTFVCLQAEFSMNIPEIVWRSGQALRPYVKDAQRLLAHARATSSTRIFQTRLDLLHLPIVDGSVTSDIALSKLADDCCQRILNGERMYIHCWGGHGRTGTLVAVILARLYGLTTDDALFYTQVLHDVRKYPQNVRSPQTQVQVEQVKRILASELPVGTKACEYSWPEKPLRAGVVTTQSSADPKISSSTSTLLTSIKNNFLFSSSSGVATQDGSKSATIPSPLSTMHISDKLHNLSTNGFDPPIRTDSLIPVGIIPSTDTSSTTTKA